MPSVTLLCHTPMPEKTIAAAARLCYSHSGADELFDGMTDERARSYVEMLERLGHESPLEHASFTFGIEGVSRAFLAQVTRHRIASFSVQSQRYVRMEDFNFITPPNVAEDEEALAEYNRIMQTCAESYARFVLPNACETKMVVTMNVRSLHNFFRLRCCNRAQWEIRTVADEMLRLCREAAPALFANAGPACVTEGKCSEGKMTCGQQAEIRKKFSK